jgi:hypothetical protein
MVDDGRQMTEDGRRIVRKIQVEILLVRFYVDNRVTCFRLSQMESGRSYMSSKEREDASVRGHRARGQRRGQGKGIA